MRSNAETDIQTNRMYNRFSMKLFLALEHLLKSFLFALKDSHNKKKSKQHLIQSNAQHKQLKR